MIIGVINFSGNVGKSTISRHLLAPRMNNAHVIPVESINSDGTEDETIRGRQFGELIEALMVMDDAVVDVGASNVEEFVERMNQYHGSYDVFDFFVVPVISERKQLRDTISTIETLADAGVPAQKIKMVFNMVDPVDSPEKEFSSILNYHKEDKTFTLSPDAIIYHSELYERLKGDDNIVEMANDKTDYKAMIRDTEDKAERLKLTRAFSNRMLAVSANKNLDDVFHALF